VADSQVCDIFIKFLYIQRGVKSLKLSEPLLVTHSFNFWLLLANIDIKSHNADWLIYWVYLSLKLKLFLHGSWDGRCYFFHPTLNLQIWNFTFLLLSIFIPTLNYVQQMSKVLNSFRGGFVYNREGPNNNFEHGITVR
jgi:hypothetical protein